jgi:hypothetical protein
MRKFYPTPQPGKGLDVFIPADRYVFMHCILFDSDQKTKAVYSNSVGNAIWSKGEVP